MQNIFLKFIANISSGILGSIVFGFIIYFASIVSDFNIMSEEGDIYLNQNYILFIFIIFLIILFMNLTLIFLTFLFDTKSYISITKTLISVVIAHISSQIIYIPMYFSFGYKNKNHLVLIIGLQIIMSVLSTHLIKEFYSTSRNILAQIFAISLSSLFSIMIILMFYNFQGLTVVLIIPFLMMSVSGFFSSIADFFITLRSQPSEQTEDSINITSKIDDPADTIINFKHDYSKDYDGYPKYKV